MAIRVDDEKKVVPTPVTPSSEADLRPGAWTSDGRFHSARMVASDATGHEFQIAVPSDTDLAFGGQAHDIDVLDEKEKESVNRIARFFAFKDPQNPRS